MDKVILQIIKIILRWLVYTPLAVITAYNVFRQEVRTNLPPIINILPNWHWGIWFSILLVAIILDLSVKLYLKSEKPKISKDKPRGGRGGKGGDAKAGRNGIAFGGPGGGGGVDGDGGDGGGSETDGDGFAMGGEGGEAGQMDRGGRGGRSPLEILGYDNEKLSDGSCLWEKGRGGDGGGNNRQLNKIVGKHFVDQIIIVDCNHYIDCTFDNCRVRWNGGFWQYTNLKHTGLIFETQNTLIVDTINIMKLFGFLEENFAMSWQMKPNEYFQEGFSYEQEQATPKIKVGNKRRSPLEKSTRNP
jgi:hypothetical protein